MLNRLRVAQRSSKRAGLTPTFCILLLLATYSFVACDTSSKAQAWEQRQLASPGPDPNPVNRAASASYYDRALGADAPLNDEQPGSSTSPPLLETVRRDSFPALPLVNRPSQFANQEELASAQHILPNVLQVTASGLTGVAEAGKNLFDGIAQVLQQSQAAWANIENAANLTRLVQESLSNRFGDQIFSGPFQLSINTTMQSTGSPGANGANKTFWLELIGHNGTATYNPDPSSYQVFRNVKDFGAKGE